MHVPWLFTQQVGAARWNMRRPHWPTGRAGGAGRTGGAGHPGGFVAIVDAGMRDAVERGRVAVGGEAEVALSPAAYCTHDLAEWETGYVAHHDGAQITGH